MTKTRCCPNCHEDVEDLGTLTLVCWSCGLQFLPETQPEDTDDGGYDYNHYDE